MAPPELTVQQAARELQVSERTVRAWCRQGRLAARKVPGKFGERWAILADDVVRKRAEASAEDRAAPDLGSSAEYLRGLMAEVRAMREELLAYREQVERLTMRLPPAPTEQEKERSPWWRFWGR